MNIIPNIYKASEVEAGKKYICPLCEVQSTSDEHDTGWVACPMLNGKAICLGCCIDYQAVARSTDFEMNEYYDLFLKQTLLDHQGSTDSLRLICLKHQKEMLENKIENEESVFKERFVTLLNRVNELLRNSSK
jgi:hypothetical protein